jgi:hypothetical protein
MTAMLLFVSDLYQIVPHACPLYFSRDIVREAEVMVGLDMTRICTMTNTDVGLKAAAVHH